MGGRAFLQSLPPGSIPRLPRSLYEALKNRLRALLLTLFAIVKVPPEKPGKKDHGDIDFIVACSLNPCENNPELVGRVLGAVQSIELDGYRTSNYAIEIDQEDWSAYSALSIPSERVYTQVDVRVCEGERDIEGLVIFHGYGDLGIMISAMAKSHGLLVNHHGLKVTITSSPYAQGFPSSPQIACPPPDPPVILTGCPRLVMNFMGLSMDRWTMGFETVEETFEFATTSRFFNPRRLHDPSMNAFNKSVKSRGMYTDFLVWVQDKTVTLERVPCRDAVEEALVVFGKKSAWDAMTRERYVKAWLKNNFNGKLVTEWTGLGWRGVKAVMDDVRSSAGGERALVDMEPEHVKSLVLSSQMSLKLDVYQ